VRNVEEISNWALTAKDCAEVKIVAFIRQQLVNILYYLDGECTQADLQDLPPGTPTVPGNVTIAHIAHFALLNQCVLEEQKQADAHKQVFHHIPHNFVDRSFFIRLELFCLLVQPHFNARCPFKSIQPSIL